MSAPETGHFDILQQVRSLSSELEHLRKHISPRATPEELRDLGAHLRIYRRLVWGLAYEYSSLADRARLAAGAQDRPERAPLTLCCDVCGATGSGLLVPGACLDGTAGGTAGPYDGNPYAGHVVRIFDWAIDRIVPPRPEGGP